MSALILADVMASSAASSGCSAIWAVIFGLTGADSIWWVSSSETVGGAGGREGEEEEEASMALAIAKSGRGLLGERASVEGSPSPRR